MGSISDKHQVWQTELAGDIDRDFLLEGINHGFRISEVQDISEVRRVCVDNHPSVDKYKMLVEKELLSQVELGNYKVADTDVKPRIISPLGAIPKDDDDVRVIHDCSRPVGQALNDYASYSPVHYQSINDAYKLATANRFMCKVDLKAAYRSVAINPIDYMLTGCKFKFTNDMSVTTLYDTRLPFGSSNGPMIFHRLSQAVKRMMCKRGYSNVVVYLDDFLILEDDYDKCVEAQRVLISLLIRLGFLISWKKLISPSTKVEFLGVLIDTVAGKASLSPVKLEKLYSKLCLFKEKTRASKKQLQSLAGSLNWACQVVQGGRYFLRRILDAIQRLNEPSHKCKLSQEFRKDLQWWLAYLKRFNGVLYYREVDSVSILTDSCNDGAGVFAGGAWQYIHWSSDFPGLSKLHINYKEVLAAIIGVLHLAPRLTGCDITIVTDSTAAKGILNKGRTKSPLVMAWLRRLFWSCARYNLRIRAIHCPGALHHIPDAISRLSEAGQALRLHSLLKNWHHGRYSSFVDECVSSMSSAAFQVAKGHLAQWHSHLS